MIPMHRRYVRQGRCDAPIAAPAGSQTARCGEYFDGVATRLDSQAAEHLAPESPPLPGIREDDAHLHRVWIRVRAPTQAREANQVVTHLCHEHIRMAVVGVAECDESLSPGLIGRNTGAEIEVARRITQGVKNKRRKASSS